MAEREERFDTRHALRWLGLIVLALALLALLWFGGKMFLLAFAGILLAVTLRAPMGALQRRTGMPDKLAYTIVLIGVLALLVGFGLLAGPSIVKQAGEFSERVPQVVDSVRDYLEERSWGRWLVDQAGGGEDQDGQTRQDGGQAGAGGAQQGEAEAGRAGAGNQQGDQGGDGGQQDGQAGAAEQQGGQGAAAAGQERGAGGGQAAGDARGGPAAGDGGGGGGGIASGAMSEVANVIRGIGITLTDVVFAIVLALFLALDPELYRRGLVRLFPAGAQQRAAEVVDELGRTLKAWLMGQLLLMTITGTLTGIGLAILGMPMVLALAFFVGLMEFIPLVGPIIGFVPILIVAATQGTSTMLWALLLYVAIQQIEGNILTPLVQQRVVALPPALTVGAVFLGGALFGTLGVVLATPMMAALFVLVKMLYVHDVLGQRVEVPGKTEPA